MLMSQLHPKLVIFIKEYLFFWASCCSFVPRNKICIDLEYRYAWIIIETIKQSKKLEKSVLININNNNSWELNCLIELPLHLILLILFKHQIIFQIRLLNRLKFVIVGIPKPLLKVKKNTLYTSQTEIYLCPQEKP